MTGKQLLAYVAFCITAVIGVEGYLIHKVFANEASRAKRVTVTETVPTNITRPCPPAKVIIIERGKLDVPIG